jgi:hypothetical protein
MVVQAGGPDIRCGGYATFGSQELSDLTLAALEGRQACLLAHHGQLAVGASLDQALALAVEVETLAHMYLQALQLGEPPLLRLAEMERVAAQMRLIATPSRIAPIKYDGRRVDDETINGVVMYVCGYIVTIGVLSVAMTLVGVDSESALMGIWTSIGNIGYGYGPLVARTGTFIDFPDAAKWLMIIAMLMGRLALLAVFVLFLPRFWAR